MTQISPSSIEMFSTIFRQLKKSWLNSPDDDVEIANDLMVELVDEIEDFLTDYQGPSGN